MTDRLNVRVMYLERTVVWTCSLIHGEEHGMVIGIFLFSVNVHEAGHIHPVGRCEDIGSFQIEVFSVEVEGPLVVLDQTGSKRGFSRDVVW